VQLIDAASDEHLWADAYTRTLENIFGVEGEVAQRIAEALKAKLTPLETANVSKAPTLNAAAYDLFLKAEYEANEASDDQLEASSRRAEDDYRRAIALDPSFALAYANMAYCMMTRHWFVKRLTPAELADVKATVDRAIILAPELPEAHLALGYFHYWGYRDYEPAIVEFQHVLDVAPSNAQALGALGFIHRRKGEWPQALAAIEKALLIAPRDTTLIGSYGETYMVMRRNAEAEPILARGLAIDPANVNSMSALSISRLFGYGDAKGARDAFARLPPERKVLPNGVDGDVLNVIDPRLYTDVFERHFAEALRAWDSAPNATPQQRLDRLSARVAIKTLANEQQDIQPECAQLNGLLEADGARRPDDPNIQSRLSWAKVCLGLNADAIRAARRAAALLPLKKDAYFGAYYVTGLAQIDARAGQPDEALQLIAQLLSMPAGEVMTVARLELDPVWDPLRGDPRFQKLIADGKAAMQAHTPP
jgi:serine/threonine-protein kinase